MVNQKCNVFSYMLKQTFLPFLVEVEDLVQTRNGSKEKKQTCKEDVNKFDISR